MKAVFPLAVLAALSGCAEFPELNGTVSPALEQAAFPRLVPAEPLLARGDAIGISEETEAELSARAARLRARAARLKGRVVDQGTRARMRDGVAPVPG